MTDSKEKIAFIVNPKSGTTNKNDIPKIILEAIDHGRFETAILFTKYAGHATELTTDFVKDGFSRVIAVGGDGTVNEVAKALINTHVALGIVPCGSGNGLGRFLQVPLKVKAAANLQNTGKISTIDCGTINGHPFFCTCGVGFDAHIGNKFAQNTSRGFWTYFRVTMVSFLTYKAQKYAIKIDSEKIMSRAFLITVANAGQYGNEAYIAPQADIRDGMLDLRLLLPFPKRKALGIGYRLFNKTMDRCAYMKVWKGKTISINRRQEGEVHLDGEPAMMGKKLKIQIIEKVLKVIIPPSGPS